jgi:hypothetical protein
VGIVPGFSPPTIQIISVRSRAKADLHAQKSSIIVGSINREGGMTIETNENA